jgi:TetR/AcrR family transcriptional repressor of nem operon
MTKPSHKNSLVDAGLHVMFRKGFHRTAVREVAAECGSSLGSFTNHFPSKEAFAGDVLDRYFGHVQTLIAQALGDSSLRPRERLLRYLDIVTGRLQEDGFTRGCLIGDFSVEVAQYSEPLREQLVRIYDRWLEPFAQCIAQGQAEGEIDSEFDSRDLADFLITSWEGAILRMKVERSPAALERFKRIAMTTVFSNRS